MTVELVLNDLRARYGPRLVLYAEDLALLLGESEEALANLINYQSLPFSVKIMGSRRCVDIYQIAQWLAHGGVAPVAAQPEASPPNLTAQPREPESVLSPPPAAAPARTKIANQILSMRHKNAGLLAAFTFRHIDQNELLFIMDVIEQMVFTEGLPAANFVLTLSSSHVSVGQGTVTEMKWLFGQFEDALKRTVERWRGPFAAAANKLVLRRGRRVLFRGIVIGLRRQILVDVVGCADAVGPDREGHALAKPSRGL